MDRSMTSAFRQTKSVGRGTDEAASRKELDEARRSRSNFFGQLTLLPPLKGQQAGPRSLSNPAPRQPVGRESAPPSALALLSNTPPGTPNRQLRGIFAPTPNHQMVPLSHNMSYENKSNTQGFYRDIFRQKPQIRPAPPLAEPRPDAISFADPRSGKGAARSTSAVVAFHYPGSDDECDELCGASFLSTFWDVGPGGVTVTEHKATNGKPGRAAAKSFCNAESAFQALKFWSQGQVFQEFSGAQTMALMKLLKGKEEWSLAGYGSVWNAMRAVLRAKFRRGTKCAEHLLMTGDAFLLKHDTKASRDTLWSNNNGGEGSNWLGLQLMLLRDELRGPEADGEVTWTAFVKGMCDIDVNTGATKTGHGKDVWRMAVRRATEALKEQLRVARSAAAQQ